MFGQLLSSQARLFCTRDGDGDPRPKALYSALSKFAAYSKTTPLSNVALICKPFSVRAIEVVVDAIDGVANKCRLIHACRDLNNH